MLSKYKYKTELHSHTYPASACSDITPEMMIEEYKKHGYNALTLTNHFSYYEKEIRKDKIKFFLEDYYKTVELGKKCGLDVLFGAELRFTENDNDYLIFGIDEEDLFTINELLDSGIDNFYKSFKNDKNIILQAHPFRDGMVLANPKSIDGIEVFNFHINHNSRIGIAAEYARKNNFIITAGTDHHHVGGECLCGILTEKPLKSSYDIADALLSKNYLLDISGYKVTVS